MKIIRTSPPGWGGKKAHAWITDIGGADSLDDMWAGVFAAVYGVVDVAWDHWQAHINLAWQRHNAFKKSLGQEVSVDAKAQTDKILKAIGAVK